eukprot:TRINITY_DN64071_c0_g1_i1.p1 TRINITY_DN64071_c0_g1~~TRINITY_DN64071_c0_g1_i1.p1  ORF type:complete len:438 (+),score=70.07 TRINITY_DN64071_c0_g1_i1:93-1406(+)
MASAVESMEDVSWCHPVLLLDNSPKALRRSGTAKAAGDSSCTTATLEQRPVDRPPERRRPASASRLRRAVRHPRMPSAGRGRCEPTWPRAARFQERQGRDSALHPMSFVAGSPGALRRAASEVVVRSLAATTPTPTLAVGQHGLGASHCSLSPLAATAPLAGRSSVLAHESGDGVLPLLGELSVPIPEPLVLAMHSLWHREQTGGACSRYVCVFETCHTCETHAMTFNHDEQAYRRFETMVTQWIVSEFPFIRCLRLHTAAATSRATEQMMPMSSPHNQDSGGGPALPPALRVGAFEVYLLRAGESDCGVELKPQLILLHSKLCSLRWPRRQALLGRLEAALPRVVTRLRQLRSQEVVQDAYLEKVLVEAQAESLGSWELVLDLTRRLQRTQLNAVTDALPVSIRMLKHLMEKMLMPLIALLPCHFGIYGNAAKTLP